MEIEWWPPNEHSVQIFQPLEIVYRYRDPQLQVAENYSFLFNLSKTICKS